jgi:hypothetical protein
MHRFLAVGLYHASTKNEFPNLGPETLEKNDERKQTHGNSHNEYSVSGAFFSVCENRDAFSRIGYHRRNYSGCRRASWRISHLYRRGPTTHS